MCDMCGDQFSSLHKCSKHKKLKHSINTSTDSTGPKYECHYCQRKCNNKYFLAEHINGHTAYFLYGCRFCTKTFLYKKSVVRHLETHKQCCEENPTLSSSNKMKCNYCDRTFNFRINLKKHIDNEHIYIIESMGTSDCPRIINSDTEPLHYGIYTREDYKQIVASKSKQCPVCNKVYKTSRYMREHLLAHSEQRKHMCDVCGKLFKSLAYVRSHRKDHFKTEKSKEKLFECALCNTKYLNKIGLKEHLITHSGNKPHTCEVCSTAFYHYRSLKRHLKKHKVLSGEGELYYCPVCNKEFVEKYEMQRHKQHKHEGQCHVCNICGATVKFNISRHMKSHANKIQAK
uniref:Zinc finger and SCAN domain-containing protein 10 n=1 Tax=Cacopsylla melanoneura TaxID=428564 RepID=A0A8D8Z754_9HEMI